MRSALRVLAAGICIVVLIGCSDDGTQPDPPFSLDLAVVDPAGNPVEGLQVLLHIPIETVPDSKSDKASIWLNFALQEAGHVRVTIADWLDRHVSTVADEDFDAGFHRLRWDGTTDEDELVVGTVPLRVRLMVETTDGDVLLDETFDMLLYTGFDVDQMPVLGFTEADGHLHGIPRDFFPFLYELPTYIARDENGNEIGANQMSNRVDIVLRDLSSGRVQESQRSIVDGRNQKQLVWDP